MMGDKSGDMITLVRWDDCGEEMDQEKADQGMADELNEEVYTVSYIMVNKDEYKSLSSSMYGK